MVVMVTQCNNEGDISVMHDVIATRQIHLEVYGLVVPWTKPKNTYIQYKLPTIQQLG